jgi:dimethylargininase
MPIPERTRFTIEQRLQNIFSGATFYRFNIFNALTFLPMLIAITREVSPSINRCELSFHVRQPIDVDKATAQHKEYQNCLIEIGVRVISLPTEPDLPDAVFVEDAAVITHEVAIISRMGAASRRPEAKTLIDTLSRHRPIKFLVEPAILDGGDVIRVGRCMFVGLSQRTNPQGVAQLTKLLGSYDYIVRSIEVRGCLHLKSACSYIGRNTILVNRSQIDADQLCGFELIDVPDEEPDGANALLIHDVVVLPASFPRTRELLEKRGFQVRPVDMSELQKAEAGVTCTSLIFDSDFE